MNNTERDALLLEFNHKFPIQRLKNLKLEEYTGTIGSSPNGERDDFTYWVETKTDQLGGISLYSYNFGIYRFNSTRDVVTTNEGYRNDNEYKWKAELGETRDEAWSTVRSMIVQIAEYSQQERFDIIDNIDFCDQYKWKTAFLYSDKKVTNIFKKDVLLFLSNRHGGVFSNESRFSDLTIFLFNVAIKGKDYWAAATELWKEWKDIGTYNADILEQIKARIEKNTMNADLVYVENSGDGLHNKGYEEPFIWIGSTDGIIGDSRCHYEFVFNKQSRNILHTMIHFESDYSGRLGKVVTNKLKQKIHWHWYQIMGSEIDLNKLDISGTIDAAIENLNKLNDLVGDEIKAELLSIREEEKKVEERGSIEKYITMVKECKNVVLTGAPGTGKTYLAKKIAGYIVANKSLNDLKEEENERIGFVQFHPSYDYTDFVEGLRPREKGSTIGFERIDGVFKSFCKRAIDDPSNNQYVFIIDEINRGEVSKIFGELFYSIDPGYRGEKEKIRIQTQYQNLIEEKDKFSTGFYVPDNVFIIGTMNDIDRSVESIDFAFRRRFSWIEVTSRESEVILDALDENLRKSSIARMRSLNEEISRTEGLSSSYHIGAAYFHKIKEYDGDENGKFNALWKYHLEPLLREYLRGMDDADRKMKKLTEKYYNPEAVKDNQSNNTN